MPEKANQNFEFADAATSSGRIVVISPHADDAAYSIGGLIQKSIVRERVHIVTLFGRSNFLRQSGFQSDWHAVTKIRECEDRAYAARIGAKLSYLDFPEAALRTEDRAIFADHSNQRLNVPKRLATSLEKLLRQTRPACLFSPLGIGEHRDHLIARRLAVRAAQQHKLPLFYYEDLPYVGDISRRKLFAYIHSIDRTLRPVVVSIDLEAKLNNLTIYRSQIAAPEIQKVAGYSMQVDKHQPAERLWSSVPANEVQELLSSDT